MPDREVASLLGWDAERYVWNSTGTAGPEAEILNDPRTQPDRFALLRLSHAPAAFAIK